MRTLKTPGEGLDKYMGGLLLSHNVGSTSMWSDKTTHAKMDWYNLQTYAQDSSVIHTAF